MGGGSSKSNASSSPRTSSTMSRKFSSDRDVSGGSVKRRRASNAAAEIAVAVGSSGEKKEKKYSKAAYDKAETVPCPSHSPNCASDKTMSRSFFHVPPPKTPSTFCNSFFFLFLFSYPCPRLCRSILRASLSPRSCVPRGTRSPNPIHP